MKLIKISIIVPVYNIEKYITRCVDSILKQTHSNLEIILVDDGSTDGSRTVIEQLAKQDERIVTVYKQNGGVTSARLAGIEKATGEWIGFVDGDDEIEPDMYEFLLKNAINSQARISHCGYQMVFADGRVNYFYNTGLRAQHDKITALKELLSGSRIEPGLCNKLFHKTLFHSLLHSGVMDTSIKINEDLLMNYHLFKQADKSVYEDRCPYHYNVRNTSASRQKLNHHKIFDPIKVKKIILETSLKELRDEAMKAYITTCINVYNGIVCSDEGTFRAEAQEIRRMILQEKKSVKLLRKKTQILFRLIAMVPGIYAHLYRFYSVRFQKNQYS